MCTKYKNDLYNIQIATAQPTTENRTKHTIKTFDNYSKYTSKLYSSPDLLTIKTTYKSTTLYIIQMCTLNTIITTH